MSTGPIDLGMASTEDLLEKYVHYVQLLEGTKHWGREKRFTIQKERVLEALKSRAAGTPRLLLPLREHPDPLVRLSVISLCKSLDPAGYRDIMESFAKDVGPIGERARAVFANDEWHEKHPQTSGWTRPVVFSGRCDDDVPTGIARTKLEELVRAEFPEDLARRVLELAMTTIGIWPRRPPEIADPTASRLGGLPLVPKEWTWPTLDGEPMLFVGQINCADLAGLPGAGVFPETGLIAFFGEHDYLHCCTAGLETECCAVFYWPDPDRLTPVNEPIEDFEQLRRCSLAFYEAYSLPHPKSWALDRVPFDNDQRTDTPPFTTSCLRMALRIRHSTSSMSSKSWAGPIWSRSMICWRRGTPQITSDCCSKSAAMTTALIRIIGDQAVRSIS